VATTDDLVALGFTASSVAVVTLNLPHPDPFGLGPFCRLRVHTTAPQEPGVYAWVADGQVCYVGKAVEGFGLVQKVKGQSLRRAYDDYTYCPPSKALKQSQTRARVNVATQRIARCWSRRGVVVARRRAPRGGGGAPALESLLEHRLAQAGLRVFEHGRLDRLARLAAERRRA
jgi:hypothetical protein